MRPSRAVLPLLGVAALALSACGDKKDDNADKTTATPAAKAVVSNVSTVPRYGGLASATKTPDSTSGATLKQLPVSTAAVVPNVKGSDAPPEQFLDTIGNDAATYWQQVFNNSGLKLEGNKQVIVKDSPVTSACGPVDPNEAPSYCEKDGGVYLTVPFFQSKVLPLGDAAEVTMVGVLYGYRTADLLDEFKLARAGKITPKTVRLHAVCYAGSWEATVAKRQLFEQGDDKEVIAFAAATADPAGTPADSPAAAGTAQERANAFVTGLKGGPAACQKLRA
jgi:predicted metalloprotease